MGRPRLLPREGWHFAALLIVLLTLAMLGVNAVIEGLRGITSGNTLLPFEVAIWALTLGFMLIAGAFGLWAIRFSTEAESLRRVSHLVASMDFIRDAVIVVDQREHVSGFNPAAGALFGETLADGISLQAAFPSLSRDDLDLLLHRDGPNELERSGEPGKGQRSYRFRSQPSKGLTLLLICDVTSMRQERVRLRQNAYLQLIGHIARGVATDFNDLLCGISGHISLLDRLLPTPPEGINDSLRAIQDCADRGIKLGAHLLELASYETGSSLTIRASEHVEAATELIRGAVSPTLKVNVVTPEQCPPLALSGRHLEQILHSLGLMAADSVGPSGTISILLEVDPGSELAVLLVMPGNIGTVQEAEALTGHPVSAMDAGVVESVVETMLAESDGKLEITSLSTRGMRYRVSIPIGYPSLETMHSEDGNLLAGLESYMAQWHVLIAGRLPLLDELADSLQLHGVKTSRAITVVEALSHIDQIPELAAIIMSGDIIGTELAGLTSAIMKLCPGAGIVALTESGDHEPGTPQRAQVLKETISRDALITALLEANSVAQTKSAVTAPPLDKTTSAQG
jgi:nitrogen-specific signal transduction histidine kinase